MPERAAKASKKSTLIAILAIACLLFAFGVIAQNVSAGTSLAFDQKVVLALRDPGNPSAPVAPHGHKRPRAT
jgi:undecaprenyl-diphosphatase